VKDKGISQIILIIGVLIVIASLAFYFYKTRFTPPVPVSVPQKVETVDQSITALDENFSELSTFEKDSTIEDLTEIEKDLNTLDLSQI